MQNELFYPQVYVSHSLMKLKATKELFLSMKAIKPKLDWMIDLAHVTSETSQVNKSLLFLGPKYLLQ